MKPTAEFLKKSFHNSGKRHLLLTGSKGSGKTTRFRALGGDTLPGFTSFAVPGSHVVLQDNLSNLQCTIGTFNGTTMEPTEALSQAGVSILRRAIAHPSPRIAMDELGYLESAHPAFQAAVLEAFNQKQVLAVVRKQDTPFLRQILSRSDVYAADLDTLRMQVGCVLMASGLSRRFGSNKLTARLHGKTLLDTALDTSDSLFHRRVVVTRSEEAAAICRQRNVDVLLHSLPYRSDTVRLGTAHLADMDALLFCPCDQPLLRRESLQRMLDAPLLHDSGILRIAWQDTMGTPMLFGKDHFRALQCLPQGKGGGYLAAQHPELVSPVYAASSWELFDIDTPADLEKIKTASV